MRPKTIFGKDVMLGRYVMTDRPPVAIFRDYHRNSTFAIDQPTVFKNILLCGGAGTGKTNVMNQILPQFRKWPEATQGFHIIFDTKGDYIRHRGFHRPGDYVIGNSPTFSRISAVWNIFDEVLIDDGGKVPMEDDREHFYEINAREIAAVIFQDRGSKTQPFFANAARDIFANTLIYFVRRYRDNYDKWHDKLNNAELKRFLLTWNAKDFAGFFNRYEDMRGLISYFGDGSSNQALGVFAELRSMVYECFQGIFALKAQNGPSFSVRRAVREKGDKALFIEYDMAVGESLTPMYRLMVDLALKEALSEHANGRVHLYLDELKLLPKVTHLQDALNFGRSKQVSVVAGIQNVDQIYATYGEYTAREILEGFGSVIAFKASDYSTREYITRRYGPNVSAYRYYTESNTPVDHVREGNTIEHWQQQELKTGQAFVGLASQTEPFFFHFEMDPYK